MKTKQLIEAFNVCHELRMPLVTMFQRGYLNVEGENVLDSYNFVIDQMTIHQSVKDMLNDDFMETMRSGIPQSCIEIEQLIFYLESMAAKEVQNG